MQVAQHLLLFTRDRTAARTVTQACETVSGLDLRVSLVEDFDDLALALDNKTVPLAVVDIDSDAFAVLGRLEQLIERFADTRFVVMCTEFQHDVVLEAMQVGARHCLVKSAIETELISVVRRLSLRACAASGSGGSLVTVLSAGGGCGSTTLSINLAEELRLESESTVLLVDLDTAYGAAGTYLGLSGEYGISDILSHPHTVDPELIRSTAAIYSDDFQVLLSPASVDFAQPKELAYDGLGDTLLACRSAFPSTVIDAPRVSMEVAGTLARASELTFLVLELDVVTIRNAKNMLRSLEAQQVPMETVVPIVNRYRKRSRALSIKDAQDALADHEIRLVRNDYQSACKSLNFGQPLATIAPRSVIRKDLRELIGLIPDRSVRHANAS